MESCIFARFFFLCVVREILKLGGMWSRGVQRSTNFINCQSLGISASLWKLFIVGTRVLDTTSCLTCCFPVEMSTRNQSSLLSPREPHSMLHLPFSSATPSPSITSNRNGMYVTSNFFLSFLYSETSGIASPDLTFPVFSIQVPGATTTETGEHIRVALAPLQHRTEQKSRMFWSEWK